MWCSWATVRPKSSAAVTRPEPPAPSYAVTSACSRSRSVRANSNSTMPSSRLGSPGPALSKSMTQAAPSGVPRRLSAHRSRWHHWAAVIGVSSSSIASRSGTSSASLDANGAPAPLAALTRARHSAASDGVGAPPVRRFVSGHVHRVQSRHRGADQRRVEHRVEVVDVGPGLHPDRQPADLGEVAAVDVGQGSRAGTPASWQATWNSAVRWASSASTESNDSLTAKVPRAVTSRRTWPCSPRAASTSSRASGPRSKRSATWAASLTVHGPMVTVVPGTRRGGGNLAGIVGRGDQAGSLRYAS